VGTDFTLKVEGANEPGFITINSLTELLTALEEPSRLKLGKELSDGAIDAFKKIDPDRSNYAMQIRKNLNERLRNIGIHPRRTLLNTNDVIVTVFVEE